MTTATRERTTAKVWPMTEGGYAIRAADEIEARRALLDWLSPGGGGDGQITGSTQEGDSAAVAEHVASRTFVEAWGRWNVCNPASCWDGTQHRPGHLELKRGPGSGVWRGFVVDYGAWA